MNPIFQSFDIKSIKDDRRCFILIYKPYSTVPQESARLTN